MWEKDSQISFELCTLDRLIPKNDKYRILKENVDLSFINDLAGPKYSHLGREGFEPVALFKMLLIMYLENIPSERELEEQIQFNIRYRFFCDLDTFSSAPDHSTFSRLRERLGDELFKEIFEQIVDKALSLGFVRASHLAIDSTSVIADCQRPPYDKDNIDPKTGEHIPSKSEIDPDARWGKKSKNRAFFGYKAHQLVDSETGFILGFDTTDASVNDHIPAEGMIDEAIDRHKLSPESLSADKAYTEGPLRRNLKKKHNIQPAIPFKNEKETDLFSRDEFKLGNDGNPICPAGVKMRFAQIDSKSGSFRYRGVGCRKCSLKSKCTTSAKGRSVSFSPDELLLLKDREFNQTPEFELLYRLRSSVERVHGDAKTNHSLARAKFRSKWKVNFQVTMTALAMNLKRLAAWLLNGPPQPVVV